MASDSLTVRRPPTADPPIREDGKCAVCPKKRKPERSKKYGGHAAAMDPFCSSACARKYWGTTLPNVRDGGEV